MCTAKWQSIAGSKKIFSKDLQKVTVVQKGGGI
jgi:hypothetical protein